MSLSDPLPGTVNVFATADTSKWTRGLRLFRWVEFGNVRPYVDERFSFADDGQLSIIFTCRPGFDPQDLQFVYSNLGYAPAGIPSSDLGLKAPSATQNGQGIDVEFEKREGNSFGFRFGRFDASSPLTITIPFNVYESSYNQTTPIVTPDAEVFMSASLPDAAGLPARFDSTRGGCYSTGGSSYTFLNSCTDAVAYRFTTSGELVWASYFSGFHVEDAKALRATSDAVVFFGGTTSGDFPVTSGAYQTRYGGQPPSPSNCCSGDLFAVRINKASGDLVASTFGGPAPVGVGNFHVGSDGSLYVVSSNGSSATAVHLDHTLARMLYSATLPGGVYVSDVHSDGSLFFATASTGGLPVSPNAYQKQPAGDLDVFVGRLDPAGVKLQYATYIGTPARDTPLAIKADRDGGAWLVFWSGLSDTTTGSVVHLNSDGSKVLRTLRLRATSIAIDDAGFVHLFGSDAAPTETALVSYPCGDGYARLSPEGEVLFASYLPGAGLFGYTLAGRPVGLQGTQIFQLSEAPSSSLYAGCLRGASLAPGQIVTIYGSGLGPHEGATYQLRENRVSDELAGTRVLFYGQPVPILYVSDTQVNAILPFEIPSRGSPVLAVQRGGSVSEVTDTTGGLPQHIDLLTVDGSSNSQALAVNEDGTLNSVANLARLGSMVIFYGIGGGQTDPPSLPGEVVPLNEIRKLIRTPRAWGDLSDGIVEFAGAAPGQVSAVNQINYRLPAALRPNANPRAALIIFESYLFGRGATIAVK